MRALAAVLVVVLSLGLFFYFLRGTCEELIVYSDLAFLPILELALKERGSNCVVVNSGPTGAVLSSIRLQKRGDLYATASPFSMRRAIAEGHVEEGKVRVIAYLGLSIVVQEGNPLNIRGLRDLLERRGLRVALAEPETVAAGQLTRELLSALREGDKSYWELLLERHNVIYKRSAPDVYNAVKLGTADAGFTYEVYHHLDPSGADVVKIEEDLNVRVSPVMIAVLKYSRRETEAFLSLFEDQRIRERMRELGYILPEELRERAPKAEPISYR
ncbi:MAG: substrate-binding domain-containing protein [Acidilobaceae archaeon]|nr:substrate-binding domain-containing protein [Acidilobaceae archaeon]